MTVKPVFWVRYSGDTDSVTVTLTSITTLLPGAVVKATLWDDDDNATTAPVVIDGSVSDAPNKKIVIPLTTWLNAREPGRYQMRVRIDNTTWPEEGLCWIDVVKTPVPAP